MKKQKIIELTSAGFVVGQEPYQDNLLVNENETYQLNLIGTILQQKKRVMPTYIVQWMTKWVVSLVNLIGTGVAFQPSGQIQ